MQCMIWVDTGYMYLYDFIFRSTKHGKYNLAAFELKMDCLAKNRTSFQVYLTKNTSKSKVLVRVKNTVLTLIFLPYSSDPVFNMGCNGRRVTWSLTNVTRASENNVKTR